MKAMRKLINLFDTETTGVDKDKDRIVEIAIQSYDVNTKSKVSEFYSKVNPEIPIPQEASEIHGIYDEDVKDAPLFKDIIPDIMPFFTGGHFVSGYNIRQFDIPMLCRELSMCGVSLLSDDLVIVDALEFARHYHKRDLTWFVKEYLGVEIEDAHTAMADTEQCAMSFFALCERHLSGVNMEDINSSIGIELVGLEGKFKKDEEGDLVFTFGKNKDKKLKKNRPYCDWMLKGSFLKDTKDIIRNELKMK